jgi:hypothetical protein
MIGEYRIGSDVSKETRAAFERVLASMEAPGKK